MKGGRRVQVEMGRVSFLSTDIPVLGPEREVVDEEFVLDETHFRICAATIGNPHCIVICDEISRELAQWWGPAIERHPMFPNRTNVQFMKGIDRNNIAIEIWERGAGYTFASGSSSCAAAASARKLGLCDADITVHVPGGQLMVTINDSYDAVLEGDVTRICDGTAYEEGYTLGVG
jgi:diaminopimelate epimerase